MFVDAHPSSRDEWSLGLGGGVFGGHRRLMGWGPQNDAESVGAIQRAVELGINWIDTAPLYGLGHSESLIGDALSRIPPRERPMVFTKCGVLWDESKPSELQPVLTPATLRTRMRSLITPPQNRSYRSPQVHTAPLDDTRLKEAWDEMGTLVEDGLVRAVGVSNFSTALLNRCESVRHIDSLQPPRSIIAHTP